MGCVISSEGDDDRRRIIGVSAAAAGSHHIVSLTSTTYGILTSSTFSAAAADNEFESSPTAPAVVTPPPPPQASPEVINSWELMAGLVDPSSTPAKPRRRRVPLRPIDGNTSRPLTNPHPPPCGGAEAGAVLYTTSLRALRSTFEACNAVRGVLQAHGVAFRERDVSMDRGFREELHHLLQSPSAVGIGGGGGNNKVEGNTKVQLPRLFVRGRLVDEVLRLEEEGKLAALLEGLPKARGGSYSCDGCGGMRFLPCFDCSGSRKLPLPVAATAKSLVVVRCRECNENGLVLCPICS